jgi:tetratricopeptide (TPR) repeat protein
MAFIIKKIYMIQSIFYIIVFLFLTSCTVFERTPSSAVLAKEAVDKKYFLDAIELYHQHIKERLRDDNRESWENPYFYLLLIGDIYVEIGDFKSALDSYEEAKNNQVDKQLYLDRIRFIAEKLEEKGEIQSAFDLLNNHLSEDPLIINELLDKLSRKL